MAARIPEHIIDEINSRVRLVDIVGETVQLKRQGNRYLGLCPFHQEKTPSFTVDPERQLFYCFGCQAGGNLFGYVQKRENVNFVEAVKILAEQAGIPLPDQRGHVDEGRLHKRQQLFDLIEAAKDFFSYQLKNHPQGKYARQYLIKRQLAEDTIASFAVGYAPAGWRNLSEHLIKAGYSPDLIVEAGLAVKSQDSEDIFDVFRERIILPILDQRKRTIGFGGRLLYEGQPKYLNSPQTILFDKSKTFYGLDKLNRYQQLPYIIIFEGYFDLISAWQGGIHNGLASLGTALSFDQSRMLKRFTDRVVLCYDADQAGERATQRSMQLLRQVGLKVDIAMMPPGQDPDDFIRNHGGQAFLDQVIEPALPMYGYFMHVLQKKHNLQSIEGKSAFVREYATLLAESDSPVEIDGYVRELAGLLDITENAIYREIQKEQRVYRRQVQKKEGTSAPIDEIKGSNIDYTAEGLNKAQEIVIYLALHDTSYGSKLTGDLKFEHFDHRYQALLEKLWPFWQGNQSIQMDKISNLFDHAELSLLAEIILKNEDSIGDPDKALYDCVEHLKVNNYKNELKKLVSLFEQVNEQGDLNAATDVLKQIQELQRKLGRQR